MRLEGARVEARPSKATYDHWVIRVLDPRLQLLSSQYSEPDSAGATIWIKDRGSPRTHTPVGTVGVLDWCPVPPPCAGSPGYWLFLDEKQLDPEYWPGEDDPYSTVD